MAHMVQPNVSHVGGHSWQVASLVAHVVQLTWEPPGGPHGVAQRVARGSPPLVKNGLAGGPYSATHVADVEVRCRSKMALLVAHVVHTTSSHVAQRNGPKHHGHNAMRSNTRPVANTLAELICHWPRWWPTRGSPRGPRGRPLVKNGLAGAHAVQTWESAANRR